MANISTSALKGRDTTSADSPTGALSAESIESSLNSFSEEDLEFVAELGADEPPSVHIIPRRSMIPIMATMQERDLGRLKPLPDDYRFTWAEFSKPAPQVDLAELMDELVTKVECGDGYAMHRRSYCVLSIAMNQLGLQAPAFRPQPSIPWKKADQTPEHMLIQRDRIVIDCHWLYATKSKVYANEGAWRGIVNPRLSLQTERIERFATTIIRNEYRADEALQLKPFQQVQMAAIRGVEVHERFRALRTAVTDASGGRTSARFRRVNRAIEVWTDSQPRFGKLYPKYRAYALALELLDAPKDEQLAKLAGLILGEKPLGLTAAAQTRSKLEQLISGI